MKPHPRNRVITFRLTEEEHDRLKTACDAQDSRIADAARNAVLAGREIGDVSGGVEIRLNSIDKRLSHITDLLETLLNAEGKEFLDASQDASIS